MSSRLNRLGAALECECASERTITEHRKKAMRQQINSSTQPLLTPNILISFVQKNVLISFVTLDIEPTKDVQRKHKKTKYKNLNKKQ